MGEARELERLTVEECLELAALQPVGRLAVATPPHPPLVVPVTFVIDGTSVVFSSDPGEKLTALGQAASFEVDWIDPVHRTGWSVLFQGRCSGLQPSDVPHLRLEPWIGPRAQLVQLVPDVITGRRLLLHVPDVDGRGYR